MRICRLTRTRRSRSLLDSGSVLPFRPKRNTPSVTDGVSKELHRGALTPDAYVSWTRSQLLQAWGGTAFPSTCNGEEHNPKVEGGQGGLGVGRWTLDVGRWCARPRMLAFADLGVRLVVIPPAQLLDRPRPAALTPCRHRARTPPASLRRRLGCVALACFQGFAMARHRSP